MTYRGPWDAAGTRHRQAPRKYVKVGPVGDHLAANAHQSELRTLMLDGKRLDYTACRECGHCVCSCPPMPTTLSLAEALDRANLALGPALMEELDGMQRACDEVWKVGALKHSYAPALLQKPLPMVHVPPPEDPLVSAEWVAHQRQLQADMQPEPLTLEGSPLRVGDMLVDNDPPKLPGLAARIFRVTGVDGGSVSMDLLNRSDGSAWSAPCYWTIADVRDELKRAGECSGVHHDQPL